MTRRLCLAPGRVQAASVAGSATPPNRASHLASMRRFGEQVMPVFRD
jgi:hypothetical protein